MHIQILTDDRPIKIIWFPGPEEPQFAVGEIISQITPYEESDDSNTIWFAIYKHGSGEPSWRINSKFVEGVGYDE